MSVQDISAPLNPMGLVTESALAARSGLELRVVKNLFTLEINEHFILLNLGWVKKHLIIKKEYGCFNL